LKSQDQDWLVLHSAAQELQDYLLSNQIHWPVADKASSDKVNLTPGMILLGLKRMDAFALTPGQREELKLLTLHILSMRKRWEANWKKKAQKEFGLRIQLWKNYLHDLVRDPFESTPFFSRQVYLRVILQLLIPDMEIQERELMDTLSLLDDELRSISTPGPFVWENEIENGFSTQEYWFLFLSLKKYGKSS